MLNSFGVAFRLQNYIRKVFFNVLKCILQWQIQFNRHLVKLDYLNV